MRGALAFWAPVAVVLGLGFWGTALALPMDSGGTPFSAAVASFSLVLAVFAEPVVLQFSWWVTFGIFVAAFRAVYRSPRPPAT